MKDPGLVPPPSTLKLISPWASFSVVGLSFCGGLSPCGFPVWFGQTVAEHFSGSYFFSPFFFIWVACISVVERQPPLFVVLFLLGGLPLKPSFEMRLATAQSWAFSFARHSTVFFQRPKVVRPNVLSPLVSAPPPLGQWFCFSLQVSFPDRRFQRVLRCPRCTSRAPFP